MREQPLNIWRMFVKRPLFGCPLCMEGEYTIENGDYWNFESEKKRGVFKRNTVVYTFSKPLVSSNIRKWQNATQIDMDTHSAP